jgi:anti-sigma factor (TIGR02949 family)
MMDCNEARDLLDAYADSELALAEAARVNRHLQDCAACRAELAAVRTLRRALREHIPRERAPAPLRARILAGLPGAESAPGWGRMLGGNAGAWVQLGLSALTAGAVALAAVLWLQHPPARDPLVQELVASHVRSLLSGHPLDVASTDQHTVKPWFNGRLDYAPPVVDLAPQGFPLAGGRVDYVGQRRVAVLTYQVRRHPIDLYVIPGTDGARAPATRAEAGYALARWQAGGMTYWAITDAAAADLQAFRQALLDAQGR